MVVIKSRTHNYLVDKLIMIIWLFSEKWKTLSRDIIWGGYDTTASDPRAQQHTQHTSLLVYLRQGSCAFCNHGFRQLKSWGTPASAKKRRRGPQHSRREPLVVGCKNYISVVFCTWDQNVTHCFCASAIGQTPFPRCVYPIPVYYCGPSYVYSFLKPA